MPHYLPRRQASASSPPAASPAASNPPLRGASATAPVSADRAPPPAASPLRPASSPPPSATPPPPPPRQTRNPPPHRRAAEPRHRHAYPARRQLASSALAKRPNPRHSARPAAGPPGRRGRLSAGARGMRARISRAGLAEPSAPTTDRRVWRRRPPPAQPATRSSSRPARAARRTGACVRPPQLRVPASPRRAARARGGAEGGCRAPARQRSRETSGAGPRAVLSARCRERAPPSPPPGHQGPAGWWRRAGAAHPHASAVEDRAAQDFSPLSRVAKGPRRLVAGWAGAHGPGGADL
jgi:hypothetical protein